MHKTKILIWIIGILLCVSFVSGATINMSDTGDIPLNNSYGATTEGLQLNAPRVGYTRFNGANVFNYSTTAVFTGTRGIQLVAAGAETQYKGIANSGYMDVGTFVFDYKATGVIGANDIGAVCLSAMGEQCGSAPGAINFGVTFCEGTKFSGYNYITGACANTNLSFNTDWHHFMITFNSTNLVIYNNNFSTPIYVSTADYSAKFKGWFLYGSDMDNPFYVDNIYLCNGIGDCSLIISNLSPANNTYLNPNTEHNVVYLETFEGDTSEWTKSYAPSTIMNLSYTPAMRGLKSAYGKGVGDDVYQTANSTATWKPLVNTSDFFVFARVNFTTMDNGISGIYYMYQGFRYMIITGSDRFVCENNLGAEDIAYGSPTPNTIYSIMIRYRASSFTVEIYDSTGTTSLGNCTMAYSSGSNFDGLLTEEDGMIVDDYCVGRGAEAPISEVYQTCANSGDYINAVEFTVVTMNDSLGIKNASFYLNGSLIANYTYAEGTTSIEQTTWLTGLLDGVYLWWYQVWDWAGNLFTSETRTLTIDTIYPSGINILYPVYGTYYNTAVTDLNFSYSDINTRDCWYSYDGGATNSSNITCANYTGLTASQGWNSWTIYVRDKAMNTNSSTVLFYMDTVAPTVSDLSPVDAYWSNSSTINFNANISDNGGIKNSTLIVLNTTTTYHQSSFDYSGLVSYWDFDTDATDSFGLNDGTVTGATHYDTGGVVGGYYKIDSGNYICFPNAAEYNFSKDTPFTISLWMNTTFVSQDAGPDSQIFGKQENSGTYDGWNIIQQDGYIFNYMNDVSGNSIIRYTEESKINYGGWVHWVYTYNASTKTVQDIVNYVNGTAIYNSVLDDTVVDTVWNDAQLCIAIRDGAGFGGWVGAVDEIGIWDRALSATDVNSLYNNRQNAYQAQTSIIQNKELSGMPDGTYTWTYGAYDYSGNSGGGSYIRLYVDTNAPTVTLISPADATYTATAANNFTCSISDLYVANITLYVWNATDNLVALNATSISGSGSTTWLNSFADGTYRWNCLGYDYIGHPAWATANYSVTIDTTAPTVTLLSPENDLWTTQTSWIFNATLTDNVGVHNSTFSIYNTTNLYNQTTFTYGKYCYQESATDTSCGAVAGGYFQATAPPFTTWYNDWETSVNFSQINDGDWDTFKNVTDMVGATLWNYVNYTIPEGADLSTSYYQIKNETGIYNISLENCVNVGGRLSLAFNTKPFIFWCYLGGEYYPDFDNWTIIARMGNVVYEEAMIWNTGTNITQSQTLTSIPDGNYKWTYNAKDWSANSYTASNYTINIDTSNPVTVLSQPTENQVFPNTGSYEVTFGCNLTDMRLANTTLYVWNNTQGLIIANTTTYTTETSATPTWTNILPKDGYFNYTCETYDYLGHSSMPTQYQFLLTPQVFFLNATNGANDSNSSPYQIGSLVYFNTTLNYASTIDTCSLVINDTGLWHNTTYQSVNASDYNLSIPYTITSISIKNASHVGWRIWCNNSEGNSVESDILVFYVNDFTLPTFTFGSNNSFTDNRTILNNKRENLTLSIGFFDYNLFAVEVNISCDKNESLYYFSVVDLNSSLYNLSATVSIYNQQPQKCNVLLSATDDHTDKDIPNYNIKAKNKGLSIEPPENSNIVDVLSQDEDYDSVSTTKQKDRYNFEFKYKEKALQRSFEVITNNDLYYREASYYPAHFVVWDSNKKVGTWLDFNEEEREKYIYSVARISDDTYNVTVTAIVPAGVSPEDALKNYGFKKLKFKSIGGTNMYNASYVFWIGADINMTSKNVYDNQSFTNWSAYIYRPSDGWNRTVDANSSSTVYVALSNDTYDILFYHQPAHYFNQTSSVIIGDGTLLQSVWYNSSQSIINYYAKRIYFNDYITGFYTRLTGGLVQTNYTGLGGNVSTFYVNASTYSYLFYKDANYSNATGSTTVTYLENKTVIIDVPFNFNFNLIDEKTGLPFNVTTPDDIKLVEFCPTNTVEYDISSSSAVVPLICEFTKIKFVLYYSTTSYFRTVILEMTPDVDSQDIYLIDLSNTDYIYNTFRLDDLFSDYEEPSVWFKKNVEGGEVLIHSDYADIENKVGAYLISNHEYIVEVHSTNRPVFVLGSYSADLTGEKILRLWGTQLNASWEHNTVANALYVSAGVIPETDQGYFFYNDFSNLTTNVDIWVVNGSVNGNVVYSATFTVANGSNAIDYLFNISQFQSERYPLYLKANITTGVGSVIPWLKMFWAGNVSTELGEDLLEELNLGFGIDENWMDIFFVVILCILALYATAFNQRAATIGLVIITAGIISFGWLNLAGYVLVIVAMLWLGDIALTRYHKR